MKPTNLFFSFLGSISAFSLSAIPSFAQTTNLPIISSSTFLSGVFLTIDSSTGAATVTGGALLTAFGPLGFRSIEGGTLTVASTNIGTPVTLTNGITDGTLNGNTLVGGLPVLTIRPFSNALLNFTGNITTRLPIAFTNFFTIQANISSGNITLPNTVISSLLTGPTSVPPVIGTTSVPPVSGTTSVPPVSGTTSVPPTSGTTSVPPTSGTTSVPPTSGTTSGGTIISIPSNLVASVQNARNILSLQPVPNVPQPFLPTSALAGSRIHPDLFAR